MNIEEARAIINDCDKQIAPLLKQRFEAILAVKKYKEENNLLYKDPVREQEILEKLNQCGPEVIKIYKEIFKIAYEIQGIK